MPWSHGFHRHRHGLRRGLHEGTGRGDGFTPLLKPGRHGLALVRCHHKIGANRQQLLATVKPVGEIVEQRVEQALEQGIRLLIPWMIAGT